ncbi:MAG: hypothetical protein V1879_00905 [Pseudomonadota bacterium]
MKGTIGFSWLCILLLLAGCAAQPIKPEEAQRLHRIGVLSLLPTDIRYQQIGITVFGNELITKPVGDKFSSLAFKLAKQTITSSTPSREVIQLFDSDQYLRNRIRSNSRKMVMFYALERIEDELRDLAKKNNLDAILLIEECIDDRNRYGFEAFFEVGLGRYMDGRPKVFGRTSINSDFQIYLISDQGKVMATAVSEKKVFQPIKPIGSTEWNKTFATNITDALHESLTSIVFEQIESELPKQIHNIGLIQQ